MAWTSRLESVGLGIGGEQGYTSNIDSQTQEDAMEISISSELLQRARELAQAEGLTVEAYVERLIREDHEWREFAEDPLDATDPEFEEVREAVMEGLEDVERGDSKPAAEVIAELRAKYGISD